MKLDHARIPLAIFVFQGERLYFASNRASYGVWE
jgi:hypothetical protein